MLYSSCIGYCCLCFLLREVLLSHCFAFALLRSSLLLSCCRCRSFIPCLLLLLLLQLSMLTLELLLRLLALSWFEDEVICLESNGTTAAPKKRTLHSGRATFWYHSPCMLTCLSLLSPAVWSKKSKFLVACTTLFQHSLFLCFAFSFLSTHSRLDFQQLRPEFEMSLCFLFTCAFLLLNHSSSSSSSFASSSYSFSFSFLSFQSSLHFLTASPIPISRRFIHVPFFLVSSGSF